MRIAYLSADYGVPILGGKGGSVHVQQLVNALARLGHEVVIYGTRLGDGDPSRLSARIVEVARPAAAAAPACAEGLPADALRRERMIKELGWRDHARALEARVLADHASSPFDLVYERYSLWSRSAARLTARAGIASVVEVNAPLLTEAEAYRELAAVEEARAIEAEVFRCAGAIVAVSDGVRDYVVARGAAPGRVHVVPNGVDPAVFDPAVAPAALDQLDGCPVIGFAGGLKPWHGLQELLGAFRIVSAARSEARLLIVGDGPMRGWVEGFVAGAGLGGKVVLTGWQPHDRLPSLVRRMDVATAPYPVLGDFYFSPLKLFEYMSLGRAIVASRIGQIASVVEEGRSGLLVEPGSVGELAQSLLRLLDDEGLRHELGAGAQAASRRYTWLENARRITELAAAQCARQAAPAVSGAGR
jgi:glycosyltransferase involved in cell wall biosynthesis